MGGEGFDLLQLTNQPAMRPSLGALMARDFSGCGRKSVKVSLWAAGIDTVTEVRLAPIRGIDEVWLEDTYGMNLTGWTSMLIDRCVRINGSQAPEGFAQRLTVADRDALILHLRMLTFGPDLWAVIRCPHDDCRAMMDFTFPLISLESPRAAKKASFTITCAGQEWTVRHREPTGSDQEAIESLIHTDPYGAFLELLSRCVVELRKGQVLLQVSREIIEGLPQEFLAVMDEVIADGITSYDWDVKLSCPECGQSFTTTLDLEAFFWEELALLQGDLFGEVHEIALFYHWSEEAILALPRWRRKLYLSHIHNETAAGRRYQSRTGYGYG